MNNFLIFYCAFAYLFELGAGTEIGGSNWWNFLFAPIIMPIKIGRALAFLMIK